MRIKEYEYNSMKPKLTVRKRIVEELTRNACIYLMALPVILYYLIFCYGPMFGVLMAFKKFEVAKGIWGSDWVGFKYFIDFFNGEYFIRTLKNTFLISLYSILLNFPAPIIFALLLNEISSKSYKKAVQMITYLPHFISMVVICGIIADFFATNGVMTRFLSLFGGGNINYLGVAKFFKPIYIGTDIWQSIGWESIIYIAALVGIDQELYEAAVIDGAGRFRQFLHITLPGISATIVIMLILRVGQLLNVGYEKIILLYNPSTYETADVISSYVYRRGLGETMQYSYSTAIGLFQSVVNLIMIFAANTFSKKISDTSLF